MSIENLFIVTAHPEFSQAAIAELQQLERQMTHVEELAPGVLLCSAPEIDKLTKRVANARSTFIRHFVPAQAVVNLANNEQDLGEIAVATIQLPGIAFLEKGRRFAVQSRFVQTDKSTGERPYTSGQLNRSLAEALAEETGAVENIKNPEIIISLLCTGYKCYIGISPVEFNLSSWPGGSRHYAQTDEQISRAEFKLLEALEVFHIELPSQGRALDLGSAPGGWSRLLLDTGLMVYSVDPARLDERLEQREGLAHYRGYAEDFLEEALARHILFDLIVNDMRMDARDAARLLTKAANCLRPDGFVISVFKLPHATGEINPLLTLKEAIRILNTRYGIVQARQLFHNRQEVTVVAAQPQFARPSR